MKLEFKQKNKQVKKLKPLWYVLAGIIVLALLSLIIKQQIQSDRATNRKTEPTQANYTESQYGIEMIYVEGETFMMGCIGEQGTDCDDDEKPAHQVTVNDFYIGKYEITQAQWQAVMGTDVKQQRDKSDPKWPVRGEGENYPMYYVNWEEVQAFIVKLNEQTGKKYRLPTEAEWEYAARGGRGAINRASTKYAGSNEADSVAWYGGNSDNTMHPVGTKRGNELDIHDMSGNVWEWCSDWWDNYDDKSQTNPAGPATGTGRVNRGGSWYTYERGMRVSFRYRIEPETRSICLGFRLACGVE